MARISAASPTAAIRPDRADRPAPARRPRPARPGPPAPRRPADLSPDRLRRSVLAGRGIVFALGPVLFVGRPLVLVGGFLGARGPVRTDLLSCLLVVDIGHYRSLGRADATVVRSGSDHPQHQV